MDERVKEIRERWDYPNADKLDWNEAKDTIDLLLFICKMLEKECALRKTAVDRWVPCPDHRDKVREGCYVCGAERLEKRIKQLEEGIKKHKAMNFEILNSIWDEELYRLVEE